MTQGDRPVILLSESLLGTPLGLGVEAQSIGNWLQNAAPVWQGVLPLAVLLDSNDFDTFQTSPFRQLLKAQAIKVANVKDTDDLRDIAQLTALQHLKNAQDNRHEAQQELAELRKDYMQLQQNFSAIEGYLLHNFAPQFTCARDWQPAEGSAIPSGRYRQRLPIGSTGFVAVDIWAMGAGKARLRILREVGEDFAPEINLETQGAGWVRAALPQTLGDLAEDIWIEVETEFGLGLSQPTVLSEMCASGANAPLALRAWRGLPEVRLPNMEAGKARFILPASAMPEPELLGGGSIKRLREREAFALHPSHNGHLDVVFRDVRVPMDANLAAYAQNFGPETVTLSLGVLDGPPPRQSFLSGESHGQFDLDVPQSDSVDLIVRLRAPTGLASVFLRGIEFFPLAR